jgi:hypothetical protein
MLMLNVKEKNDYRPNLTVTLTIPKLDLMGIDEILYEKEHNTLTGYEPGEEVDVRVLGINFKLIKKEEGE